MKSSFNLFLNYSTIPLIFLGCRLNRGKMPLKIIQTFFLLLSLFFLGNCSIRWFFIKKGRRPDKTWILWITADVIFSLGGFATIFLFVFKRKVMILLFKRIFLPLYEPEQGKVVKTAFVAAVVITKYTGINMVLQLFVSYLQERLTIGVLKAILEKFCIVFVFTGVVLYMSFCSLLYRYVVQKLVSVNKYILKERLVCDFQVINATLISTHKSMNEFDDIFNILPFIWLVENFTSASANVLAFLLYRSETAIIYTAIFIFENVATVLAIVLLSLKRKEVGKQVELIRYNLTSITTHNESSPFVKNSIERHLELISSFKMTALTLFPFDGPLILSFLGSVVNFTVLIIELTK